MKQDLTNALDKFWSELPPNPEWDSICPPPHFDEMSPPKVAIDVHCLHCGLKYNSRLIAWGRKIGMRAGLVPDHPLWWCPSPFCDGGGFGHDIHPIGILGGRNSNPLTLSTISDWKKYRGTDDPNRDRKKLEYHLRLDDIHCDWLADRLVAIDAALNLGE